MRNRATVLILGTASATVLALGILLLPGAASWLALRQLLRPFQLTSATTPLGPAVLEQVQRLNRLETCRYTGQVIVRGDTRGILPTWLAGDRMLFVGRGEVVAGVDLSGLRTEDVTVDGSSVSVRLPRAEVLHTRLDNRQSQVYERRAGLFTGPDPQLETRVRIRAEEQIRSAALESGLLATADANAQEALRRQLAALGFREVRFF